MTRTLLLATVLFHALLPIHCQAAEPVPIWPDFAPGEKTKNAGTPKTTGKPPTTRVHEITYPTLQAYIPEGGGNGSAIVVLPGGGFSYAVTDKEGSETAAFLNPLGISVFVLSYRTSPRNAQKRWRKPLQDSQRAIRFLRANAEKWKLDPKKIGLMGFSAGGQAGAMHIGDFGDAYEKIDAVDKESARPDFALLVYPWNLADQQSGELLPEIKISKNAPPTFLIHAHDDASSSIGSASLYIALKKAGVPAELHVYQNGGHGYGIRARKGSVINTWTDRASDWLRLRGIGK